MSIACRKVLGAISQRATQASTSQLKPVRFPGPVPASNCRLCSPRRFITTGKSRTNASSSTNGSKEDDTPLIALGAPEPAPDAATKPNSADEPTSSHSRSIEADVTASGAGPSEPQERYTSSAGQGASSSTADPLHTASPEASINPTSNRTKDPAHPLLDPTTRAKWQADLKKQVAHMTTSFEGRLANLGVKLNEVTGYKEVERLKDLVTTQELRLEEARRASRKAKSAYEEAISNRSNAQRDVNSLLERKHSWTDADVMTFTRLVRQDHQSSSLVSTTSIDLKEKEVEVDKSFSDLTKAILQRYHEEQVWSDKIRNVSTWANMVGLLVNFLIFLGAIAIVEPWKRRRLVERFEERMTGVMDRLEAEIKAVDGKLVQLGATKSSVIAEDGSSTAESPISGQPTAPDPSTTGPSSVSGIDTSVIPSANPFGDSPLDDESRFAKLHWPVKADFIEIYNTPLDQKQVLTGAGGAILGLAAWALAAALSR